MKASFRYVIRLINAFIGRFKVIIGIGFLIGVIFCVILLFVIPDVIRERPKMIGMTGRFHTEDLPYEIVTIISQGLTTFNQSNDIEPGIAEKWETTDGGKSWIFSIKDNFFWQDGTRLISSDIKYHFEGVNTTYPDDKTIVFELTDAYAPFPSVVTQPIFKRGLLGLGKWTVKKATVAGGYVKQLELINNKKERLIYRFYPSEERTKLAFKMGQVDTIQDIYNPSPFDDWQTSDVTSSRNQNLIVTIFFNTDDKFLADKSLRQALIYAIDKKVLSNYRAISPIPSNSWAYNPLVKSYDQDVEKAKSLVNDLDDALKNNLEINLVTTPTLLPIAEKIVNDWKNVNVTANALVSSVIPDEYQAFLAIFESPKDPDQYSIWHSTQTSTNISRYKNPRIDKLLEDGRSEINTEQRRKIYLDFQRFLVEDSPAAFLYYPESYTISRK